MTHILHTLQAAAQVADILFQLNHAAKIIIIKKSSIENGKHISEAVVCPAAGSLQCHLLDFGSLGDTLQVLLEHQDFGVFLLQDGDQVVQESDVSAITETHCVNVSNGKRRF